MGSQGHEAFGYRSAGRAIGGVGAWGQSKMRMECTYFWERIKLRTDGIYAACDTDRIVEDRVVSVNLI